MLARIVRDADTQQLTWQRITGDAGSAGATPLGSVLAYFGTTVPEGFLPCNGATYDVTQYPELYAFLNSSTLPDLRECALVGIGENSTDTLGTHDIFTLGQFKDSGTYGTNTTSWEALHPYDATNNVMTTVINTTGAEQIVTAKTGTSTAALGMRTRSKGVNWIIKAVPGMETTEVTDAIEAINEKLAKALVTKDVLTLPTGAGIEGYIYHYQGHYYVPHIDVESPAQSYLTELANLSDIQPVIEWLASTDPLPTGSAIEEHLYAQEYTTAGGDTKYHYYIGKVDSSDPLNNELVALETGAGASIFVGTQAEWEALSTAEKNEYQQADLTDVNSVVHVPVDTVADGNMNPVTSNAVYDRLAYRVIPTGVSIDELIGSEYVGTYKVTTSTYMPYVCGSQLSSGTLVVAFDGTSTVQTILGDGYTARRVHNGTSWKNYSTSNNDNISTEQYPYGWRVTYGQSYNGEYIFNNGWNDVICLLSIASGIPVVHLVGSNNTPDIVGNGYVVFPRESLANALWRFGMNPTSFARWYWTCSGTFDHGNVQLFAGAYSSFTNPFFVRSNSSLSGTRVNLCFIPWMIN